jgi:hypothetical protein
MVVLKEVSRPLSTKTLFCTHEYHFTASRPAHYTVLRDDNFTKIPAVYVSHLFLGSHASIAHEVPVDCKN